MFFFSEDVVVLGLGKWRCQNMFVTGKTNPQDFTQVSVRCGILPACSIGARCEVYGNNVWTFPTSMTLHRFGRIPRVTGSYDHAFNWNFSKMCIKFSCKKDQKYTYILIEFWSPRWILPLPGQKLVERRKKPKKPNPKNPVVLWFCHGKAFLDSTRFTSSASQRMLVKKRCQLNGCKKGVTGQKFFFANYRINVWCMVCLPI